MDAATRTAKKTRPSPAPSRRNSGSMALAPDPILLTASPKPRETTFHNRAIAWPNGFGGVASPDPRRCAWDFVFFRGARELDARDFFELFDRDRAGEDARVAIVRDYAQPAAESMLHAGPRENLAG